MNLFSPELLPYWIPRHADTADDPSARREDELSPSLQEALKALADRVNAARSTV